MNTLYLLGLIGCGLGISLLPICGLSLFLAGCGLALLGAMTGSLSLDD